ncbi:class I SAM-dependent methyltransferase [Kitasatospora sp. MAP5-34]|uniref:O-methyltransferase n=1 Tax=Kitasatospora sp. MAP5-34 TaxID=3035102 RepID=UPI002474F284|nr:class I SAM-dependent methyltransferase [Kitasatospora sp. MAP5-34]MDH6579065.1 putative O-methyltransferase YrrM [Kitasatospora sp. MAP5-34]
MPAYENPNSLHDPKVAQVLAALYEASRQDDEIVGRALAGVAGRAAPPSLEESVELVAEALLPVQPRVGELLYLLVRSLRPTHVVEFGTSFGISLIHLAAGVRDNGFGSVVGSELSASKVVQARKNLASVGLADVVEIREGDARETLASVPGPIDLILLDGWKDLCLPVLELLEPKMHPGTVVLADNLSMLPQEYLDRVRTGGDYVSVDLPVGEGIELSTRITAAP